MKAPDRFQPRFWIFQATPEKYNLSQKMRPSARDTWSSGKYARHVQRDDVVFFLQSGTNSSFQGWGTIVDFTTRDSELSATVEYREVFGVPVPLAELASDAALQYISRLRFSQGTIFKLTSLEGEALQQYLRTLSLKVPDIELPEVIPLRNIWEYNLSRSPMKLLNGALSLSSDILDIVDLRNAFLKLLVERIGNPNKREDTTTFLLRYLNASALRRMVDRWMTEFSPVPVMEKQSINPPKLNGRISQVFLNVMRMLQHAKQYAIRTTRSERIFTRHLMVALWEFTDLDTMLVELGLGLDEFKRELLNYLPERYENDNFTEWKNILLGTSSDTTFQQFIARLNSDDAEGEDLLNIEQDVGSLASVITARDIGPPLAIGLFGDWGSGKTFFMKKLKSRIGFLSENARKNPTLETSYCRNVISIWFNAWHYLDSNLWASLIDHIFNSLEQHILQRQEEAKRSKRKFNDPLTQLLTIQRLKSEADEKRKAIRAKQVELIDKKKEIEGRKQQIEKRAQSVLTKDGWSKALTKEITGQAKELIGKLENLYRQWDKGNEGVKDKLKHFNESISQEHVTLSDLQPIIAEATHIVGSGKQVWQRVLVNLSFWKLFVLFIVVLGLAVLGMVWFKDGLATVLAQFISVTGLLIGFTRNQLNLANGLLDISENLREKSQMIFAQDERNREKEMAYLNEELNRLNDSIISTEEQLNKVNEEVYSIALMEKKMTSARRLIKFINDRARSEDYSRHLGLISLIRKDFEELTKLMFPPEEEKNPDYSPPIERIVLFIDDLDRCSEEKVMEVLQAVHLLLAFRLFVVVVGVDARWVSKSIKQVYPHLLNEWEQGENGSDESNPMLKNAASTQDYLEKIFQIPFWLKAIDNSDLVASLIKGTLKSVEGSNTELDNSGTGNIQGVSEEEDTREYEPEELSYEEFDPNPEFLMLNQNELEFMSELGPIAGMSPRAIKRYLNLYRLIKGTCRDMQLPSFNEKGGGYAEVQLLLALQSGYALELNDLLELMKKDQRKSLKSFLNEINEEENGREWDELIPKLKKAAMKNAISTKKILDYHPRICRYSYHYQKV